MMNNIRSISAFMLVFLLSFCFADRLEVTTENVVYLPYQPIYINAYYDGERMVTLGPAAEEIVIHIRNNTTSRETEYKALARVSKVCDDCMKSKLEPAKIYKITNVLNITSDARGWLFENPGDYSVWVSFADGSVFSNTVAIRIAPPQGEDDIATAEIIKKCPGFSMLEYMEGGDMFAQALAKAEDIAAGKSGYAGCMRDLLVKHYCQESCSIDGVKRLPDMTKVKYYYNTEPSTGRYYSKTRSLTLMGRLAKNTLSTSDLDFVKNEYRNLKNAKQLTNMDNYINKNFVE